MTFETVLLDFLSLPFLVETFRILTGGCMCSSSHMGSKSNVAMHAGIIIIIIIIIIAFIYTRLFRIQHS